MSSQILRPTTLKREKGDWLIQGVWGRRHYGPMSKVELYRRLHSELVDNAVLPASSPEPSNKHHSHVTMAIMRSSWINGQWVADEPFATRLKKLREKANLTQEQLAAKSDLDVGTIRQLEQGARTNPQWQTVCALAHGLGIGVVAFLGTEGWEPPESEEQRKTREDAEKLQIIEADIIMRLESLGHLFDRRIDLNRKAQMRRMTKPELQKLAEDLRHAPTWQDAITIIVAAICASEASRRADEDKQLESFGPARVDMNLET